MKKPKINSTLRTIILSYIVVLLLPLLFGIILYSFAIQVVRTEADRAQLQVIDHVEDSVNYSIESMNNVIDALLVDNKINTLSKKTYYNKADYLKMRDIQNQLNLAAISNSYIDDIIIYFHQTDTVLSTQYYLSQVGNMEGKLDILTMDVSTFQQQLEKQNDLRFFITSSTSQKMPFIIRSNGSATVSGEPSITIFIRMMRDSLNKLLQAENAETFLFNSEADYLCTSGAEKIGPAVQILAAADAKKNYEAYRLLDYPSALLSLRYIRLIPKNVYAPNIFYVQLLLIGYIGICLAIGIPLAASMVRKSYNPIKQIVSILPDISSQQDANDFQLIENSLTDLVKRNTQNEEIIDRQSNAMKNYLMYKVIQEGEGFRQQFLEGCRRFGTNICHQDFLMIGIDIEDGSNLFFENQESVNQEMSQLAFFAITNILTGKLGTDYPFFLAEYDGILLALVNTDERFDKDHILHEVRGYSNELFERMEKDFRVEISISISNIHHDFFGIPICYQEVQEILEHRAICKTGPVLQYREIQLDANTAAIERAAVREIRNHSYHKARELLDEVIGTTESKPESPPQEGSAPEDPKSLSSILAYIDAHYTDPNLSVSAIAQQFNMTPSYLSLYFKRKTGLSPLEYIHQKRIEQVKILLETDLSIKAIARETGYFDTRPMIRFFKRTEGITPTEYREKLRSQK